MKKLIGLIMVIVMLSSLACASVYAEDTISVTINGKAQAYDVMPVIVDSRTLVPMRGIFEALGAEIEWDDSTKTVTGTKGDTKITLQIGNKEAKVGDSVVTLDVPATIVSDRTMVPVRFISESLGCKVDWDGATKTVIINSSKYNMAELVSEFHRPVPAEFTKSSSMDDMIFYGKPAIEEQEKIYADIKAMGELVCSTDKFMEGLSKVQGPEYGNYEVIDVEGQPFTKSLKITCNEVPEKSSKFIVRTSATPEKNPGDGVKKEDMMLFAFRFRLLEGGNENGRGEVQIQIEHPETYKKALFQKISAGKDWEIVYMPFTGVENATSIGIRPGFSKQVIELGGVEIVNMGPDFDSAKFPRSAEELPELSEDAEWRKDAIERIEKIRKGDFSVIVKDKDGNVIPDAEVEFDMFEHEFQFGTAFNNAVNKDETYAKNLVRQFNTGVETNDTKWGPFEGPKREQAIEQFETAVNLGIKYMRGHCLFWERPLSSSGGQWLTPEYMYSEEIMSGNAREKFDEYCRKHVEDICTVFKDRVTEWDVVNEIVASTDHRDVYGVEIYKQWFDLARQYAGDDCVLYYNETAHHDPMYFTRIDELVEIGADFDALGIQSHYDGVMKMPSEVMKLHDDLRKYGKRLKVTEYSNSISDIYLQANYMRDMLIVTFAEEMMDGFVMWGFNDANLFANFSPMYDNNWNLKPSGLVWEDMVYNKWWTKDAKATTGADGKATVRGYYGDYDVTVTANGKTTTQMVAFHKGYDNVLEIVLN